MGFLAAKLHSSGADKGYGRSVADFGRFLAVTRTTDTVRGDWGSVQ
jgi:hypothetical protein